MANSSPSLPASSPFHSNHHFGHPYHHHQQQQRHINQSESPVTPSSSSSSSNNNINNQLLSGQYSGRMAASDKINSHGNNSSGSRSPSPASSQLSGHGGCDEEEDEYDDSQSINAANGEWTYEEQFKQVSYNSDTFFRESNMAQKQWGWLESIQLFLFIVYISID